MAKKKRSKRLKKLAKVLGAGLAIAGLGRAFANRNARASTNADAIKAMTSDAAYTIPGGDESSFKVQDVKVNVPTNNNTFRTRNRITDSAGNTLPSSTKAAYVQRAKDSAAADAMRAFRSNNAYRGDMMTAPRIQEFKTSEFDYFSKGGRVKKRTGAAKRGFGRAFKGGKK